MRSRSVFIAVVLLATLVACGDLGGQTLAPPDLEVSLSRERVSAGTPVTLSWVASDDASVTIDGDLVATSGDITFTDLRQSRDVEVVARRGGRVTERHVRLLVDVYRIAGEVRLADTAEPELLDVVPGEFIVTYHDGVVRPSSGAVTVLASTPLVRLERHVLPLADGAEPRQLLAATLATIASDPAVRSVIPNRYVTPAATNDPLWPLQWGLNGGNGPRFDIAPLWHAVDPAQGAHAVIAVIDTGVLEDPQRPGATHPDLDCGRLLPGISFLRTGISAGAVDAWAGGGYHGSHVLGIAGACTDNAEGIAGVDPYARLLPIRVFDDNGIGTLAEVIQALRWAAGLDVAGAPRNDHPADVINLSLGAGGSCDGALAAAASSATAAGSIVVAAAGNRGATGALVPAACPTVISVGAVGPHATVPSYSDRGPLVDVFAPGGDMRLSGNAGIVSTVRDAHTTGYAAMEGTSMAAPYVAGVIALLRARHADLSWWRAREVLTAASDTLMIHCRVTITSSELCPARVLDLTRVADREPPLAMPAHEQLVLIGDTSFAEGQAEVVVQLMNVGVQRVQYLGLRSTEAALSAVTFSSGRLDPQTSVSLLLRIDRERLPSERRVIDAVIETDIGDLPIRVALQRSGIVDVGTLTISVTLERDGQALRSTQTTISAADAYTFALDLDLGGIGVRSDDLFVLRASSDALVTVDACSHARLRAHFPTPVGATDLLVRPPFRLELVPTCQAEP